MLRSVIVLAFALACVASGCSDERSAAGQSRDTSVLSGAELGWLRSYSSWTFGFYDDELKVGPAAIGDCQDEVERIGPAPTERFEEATSRLAAICPLLERIGSVQRAQDEVEYVDDLLRPYLRDEQPLRLRSGVTDRSRADVVLSDIASDFLGRPVEVRCWDEEDWERVLAEDDAWNDDDHDAEIVGWSADSTDRIHLCFACATRSRMR